MRGSLLKLVLLLVSATWLSWDGFNAACSIQQREGGTAGMATEQVPAGVLLGRAPATGPLGPASNRPRIVPVSGGESAAHRESGVHDLLTAAANLDLKTGRCHSALESIEEHDPASCIVVTALPRGPPGSMA